MKEQQTYFRLKDRHTEEGVVVYLERWYAVKATPKGVWVRSEYSPCWKGADFKYLKAHKHLKFILNSATKKHCHPTIEGAIESFKMRKHRQYQLLSAQMEQAKVAVENLDKLDGVTVDSFAEWKCVQLGWTA